MLHAEITQYPRVGTPSNAPQEDDSFKVSLGNMWTERNGRLQFSSCSLLTHQVMGMEPGPQTVYTGSTTELHLSPKQPYF